VGGRTIGAREAERIGLINHVYADHEFESHTTVFLNALTDNSASAMALTKRLLYRIDGMTFEVAMQTGAEINTIARMTDDLRRGVAQFLDRKHED
jgi:methylglutaconyl-CoA hydratase